MRILITGVTGLVGKHFARAAFERGHEVRALGRNPRRINEELGVPCPSWSWEAHSGAQIPKEALEGVQAIVHLAGEPIATGAWDQAKKAAILDSRVRGTEAIRKAIEALPSQARPKVWLSASAIGIYGDRGNAILDESSAPATSPDEFLARVCLEWEAATRSGERTPDGTRVIHLRFGIILSNEGGALEVMALPFRLGVGGQLGSGTQWMSWVHLEDVVQSMLFALESEKIEGPVNVTSPEPATNHDFTKALASSLRVPALMRVPKLALAAALREKARMILSSQRVLPSRLLEAGYRFRFRELRRALEDLLSTERIEAVQWIPRPLPEVFRFFSDARNLERLTPPWLEFAIQGAAPKDVTPGTRIRYQLRIHGVPVKWESLIDRFEPGQLFRDVQVKGPYKRWEHIHLFTALGGGTLVKDSVRYEAPLGILGRAVGGQFLKRDIAKIFDYRRKALRELFPGSDYGLFPRSSFTKAR